LYTRYSFTEPGGMEGWVGPSTTSVNNLIIDSRPGGARTQSLTRDLTLRHAAIQEEEEEEKHNNNNKTFSKI